MTVPPRGLRGRGGGRVRYLAAPAEWRGTSVHVCGMWPWAAGSSAPLIGVPVGRIMAGRSGYGSTLCCDPISWFSPGGLIANPSAFILGLPGLGKSKLAQRIGLGLAGMGVHPLILGDLKPDYVAMVEALGGQVITLGRGRGYLNILDPGEAIEAANRLTGKARTALLADVHGRQLTMMTTFLTIQRHQRPKDREESIIDVVLRILRDRGPAVPLLGDVLQVVQEGPPEVRAVAIDRGSDKRYQQITEDLEASLIAMMGTGRLGEMFAQPTTTPMRHDRAVTFHIAVDDNQTDLQQAALLACWSYGFGTVNVAKALADAGLEPERHYLVILDELWKALRAGLVDAGDALTRLNRNEGVGQLMITHSMADLKALKRVSRMKAQGFVERAGMVISAGLPLSEMPLLSGAVGLSEAEQVKLASWTSPPLWNTEGRLSTPPGLGNFLVKVGGRPGIPFHMSPTRREMQMSDTNQRWQQWAAR